MAKQRKIYFDRRLSALYNITLAFAFTTKNIYQSDVHKDRKKVFSLYTITQHLFQSMSFNLYTKVGNSEKQ